MSIFQLLELRATSLTESLDNLVLLAQGATLSAEILDAEFESIRRSYECWTKLWARIESEDSIGSDEFLKYSTLYSKIETEYKRVMSKLYLYRSQLNNTSTSSQSNYQQPRLKLPEVKIEPFKGDVGNWEAWWTSFKDMVDNQPIAIISVTARYQLLLQSVEGDPKKLVQSPSYRSRICCGPRKFKGTLW